MGVAGGSISVLYVDDDPDFAKLVQTVLERKNERIAVVTETSASSGLERSDGNHPRIDCIVSDYDMPEMTGLELLERVRKRRPETPFILLTGKGSETIASEAISAGVTDYFQKKPGVEHYELLAKRIVNAVEQERAKRTAERTRRRLREIAEKTNDILWMSNDDWTESLFVNSAYEDIMGQSVELVQDQPLSFLEAIHPDDRQFVREQLSKLSEGQPVDLELRVNESEDYQRWSWVQAEPIFDDNGDVVRIVGFARDITEIKQYSTTLQELHRATRDLVEATSKQDIADRMVEAARDVLDMAVNGFWLYDETAEALRPIAWTDEAAEVVGEPPTYYTGEGIAWDAFVEGEVRVFDDVSTHPQRYNDRTPIGSEIILPLDEYGIMIFGATSPETFDETDVALAEILVANAETALGRIERESALERQNERLDKFASIVSHDLRNPLNVAEGRLEMAQRECESEHLEHVERSHDRMKALIEDVLTWAREGEAVGDTEAVDLNEISNSCWKTVNRTNATLVTDTERTIQADRPRLQRLLENLFRNAIEHGGTDVTVTVGEADCGFYVADNGPGIPETDRQEIFETGYSTSNEGTGFGLSIVQQIADAHDWDVTARTDDGARFEISGVEFADRGNPCNSFSHR